MRRLSIIPMLCGLLLALMLPLAGCQGTKAAYQAADSLDEYAYVLTEQYASLVHEAAQLVAKPTTPTNVKDALRIADHAAYLVVVGDAIASPAVPGIAQLAANYKQIHNAQTQEELQAAINVAVLKIADLVRAVKAARGTP